MAEIVLDIKIIAVGKIKDCSLASMIKEYTERISHDAKLQVIEIGDSNPEKEGTKILEHLKKNPGHVIVLTQEGRQFDSVAFSRYIGSITHQLTFIIGGPSGLSAEVKKAADLVLSLSAMTFTHEIARMLLLEQIYRAISIIRHRRYHK
ncbi:MAG: 23S rRNA (pseudouridine(1915)-N(3))-methyltransferase RlmH [Fibrobacter sp.]|jgi:23S rRNA (pseudouridine1915-N3)-methyltransferase|nr:23S rRNA (pseudouridine(1915)-N(3))-methyltransferase RlmH [Fibrobacter sp.]